MATITSFSPTSGTNLDVITIIGTGFTGATGVVFGNVSAHSIVVVSDTEIQATLGPGATGNVTVHAVGGDVVHAGFTYNAQPAITGFTPTSATPGQMVTINGSGFTGTTSVKFGGVDCMVFLIVSDTQIKAYPAIGGSGTVSVTNPFGTSTVSGFTQVIVKVSMPNSPALGRAVAGSDLVWIWDSVKQVLTQTTVDQLPSGTGTGGTGGEGNVFTALGSPFKVRNTDDSYTFNDPDSVIFDLRLLGKTDYIVYSSDLNAEFDNYEDPTDAKTATSINPTTAPDGIIVAQPAVTVTGSGSGSLWTVETSAHDVTLIEQIAGGTGYIVGDTFTLAALPGVIFTVASLGSGIGNLIFDPDAGSVTIKNYRLSDNKHITIFADGVLSTPLQDYILALQAKIAIYDMVVAPVVATGGTVWPWRKAASLIPVGWQECTDFRGKILIGQDPTDIYNSSTNPLGLSQPVGTSLGGKTVSLGAGNIPEITINLGTDSKGGSSGYKVLSTVNHDGLFAVTFGNATPAPFAIIPPVKIVDWIEYIGATPAP